MWFLGGGQLKKSPCTTFTECIKQHYFGMVFNQWLAPASIKQNPAFMPEAVPLITFIPSGCRHRRPWIWEKKNLVLGNANRKECANLCRKKMSSPPKEWINLVWLVICGAKQRNAQINVCNASGFKSNDVVSMRKMAFAKTCFISVWHQLSDVCAWGWNSACVRRFSALCVCENNSVHYKFEITVIPAWFALLCCQTVCAEILKINRQTVALTVCARS